MKEPPSLKDMFNKMSPLLENEYVLRTYNGVSYLYYDFAQRVVMHHVQGGSNLTPFAELDRDTLIAARDKLVELGGNPPGLPDAEAAKPALPRPKGTLNP